MVESISYLLNTCVLLHIQALDYMLVCASAAQCYVLAHDCMFYF